MAKNLCILCVFCLYLPYNSETLCFVRLEFCGQVMGLYPGDPGPPGADCAGTILELGERVRHLRTTRF